MNKCCVSPCNRDAVWSMLSFGGLYEYCSYHAKPHRDPRPKWNPKWKK